MVKVKLSLYVIKYLVMKTNGGIAPPLLNSALYGGGQLHAPAALPPEKQLPLRIA
jgi:hypothetical protein